LCRIDFKNPAFLTLKTDCIRDWAAWAISLPAVFMPASTALRIARRFSGTQLSSRFGSSRPEVVSESFIG